MNEKYDVIILGTGLKECVLSGILSVEGKKVLHLDRNNYYGAETASLNLKQLYEKFKPGESPKDSFGDYRSYIVDLCPKFLMACGNLVKMLVHTKVTRYIDFKVVQGSYVYKDKKLHKMPSTPSEALSSTLMGFFQKRRLRNFLTCVANVDSSDLSGTPDIKSTMRETFKNFSLDGNSIASIGHALALQQDDSYLDDPQRRAEVIDAIKLYSYSVQRYGKSPFIYPIYSLSGLPEGFARLSAVYGGTYMLGRKIEQILFDEATGRVKGVRVDGEEAFCDVLLADPSYFPQEKSQPKGRIARWICILAHPLPLAPEARSCQVIVPGAQVGRKSDVYVAVVSSQHKVAPREKFLAIVSTLAETDDPRKEIEPLREMFGEVEEEFFFETEYREPTLDFLSHTDKTKSFMSSSYDATTHFETVSEEVLRLYKSITGKEFDLDISAEPDDVNN